MAELHREFRPKEGGDKPGTGKNVLSIKIKWKQFWPRRGWSQEAKDLSALVLMSSARIRGPSPGIQARYILVQ